MNQRYTADASWFKFMKILQSIFSHRMLPIHMLLQYAFIVFKYKPLLFTTTLKLTSLSRIQSQQFNICYQRPQQACFLPRNLHMYVLQIKCTSLYFNTCYSNVNCELCSSCFKTKLIRLHGKIFNK